MRNHESNGVETRHGAFLSSPLPVAGFALIEAADLAAAIELVSRPP